MSQEGFFYDLEGLKELDNMLQALPKLMARSVLRKALRKAAEVTRIEAQKQAPTRAYAETFAVSSRLSGSQRRKAQRPGRGEVFVYVGSYDPLAHLIEWGTVERFRKSGGSTGIMPADPSMTRAWNASKEKALHVLVRELAIELEKGASRLYKKASKGTLSHKQAREIL